MTHVDDKLAELALDLLAPEERAAVVEHLDVCERCRDEYRALLEATVAVACSAPPARPSGELRRRLVEHVSGPARYAPFAGRIAKFFGITPSEADAALERITDDGVWKPAALPGMSTASIPSRTSTKQQTAVFLRSEPGTYCPAHRHIGEERLLIIQGSLIEADGGAFGPGDVLVKPAGSAHAFHIPAGEACVAAYLLDAGIELVA